MLLDQRAKVFVAGVVVDEIAPAGQDVVFVRRNDALELRPRRVRLGIADGHRHGCGGTAGTDLLIAGRPLLVPLALFVARDCCASVGVFVFADFL